MRVALVAGMARIRVRSTSVNGSGKVVGWPNGSSQSGDSRLLSSICFATNTVKGMAAVLKCSILPKG